LMADIATRYQRNQMLGQMLGQQLIWTQVESFSRLVHASLDPVEVAYQIANDGRRLVNCDRLSVGICYGKKPVIEAISGADVVEKRSNLVRLMQRLSAKVLEWGKNLFSLALKKKHCLLRCLLPLMNTLLKAVVNFSWFTPSPMTEIKIENLRFEPF